MASTAKDLEKLNFEQAMDELEKIVGKLEAGNAKLEDAIGDYERGAMLKKRAEALLQEAEVRVQKIVAGKSGEISTEPLDQ